MSKSNKIGIWGEQFACDFLLKEKNHKILHTNYRYGHKEVDIISLDKDTIVFTEVKTRSSLNYGYPEEFVNITKQKNLKAISEQFLDQNQEFYKIRFDIISILVESNKVIECYHIEDAFY